MTLNDQAKIDMTAGNVSSHISDFFNIGTLAALSTGDYPHDTHISGKAKILQAKEKRD